MAFIIQSSCVIMLMLILITAQLIRANERPIYNNTVTSVNGLEISNIQLIAERLADRVIYHIDEDLFKPGNLLLTDLNSLKTTDFINTSLIAGGKYGYSEGQGEMASFKRLFSFLQLNRTTVLAVDSYNFCLRLINRETNETAPFVGTCKVFGYQDGYDAKFSVINVVLFGMNDSNLVYILDSENGALRLLDLRTRYTRTLFKGLSSPGGMSWLPDGSGLYISSFNYLLKYNPATNKSEIVLGGTSNFIMGWIGADQLLALSPTLLLTAGYSHIGLKVVNLETKQAISICTGNAWYHGGLIGDCNIADKRFLALMYKNRLLYIGTGAGSLAVMNVKIEENLNMSRCVQATDDQLFVNAHGYYEIKTCSAEISVLASESTRKAEISLNVTKLGHVYQLSLPIGHTQWTVKDNSECHIDINVDDPGIVRKLILRAQYKLYCALYNEDRGLQKVIRSSSNVIKTLIDRIKLIQVENNPEIECRSDLLTLSWETDMHYDTTVTTTAGLPDSIERQLREAFADRDLCLYVGETALTRVSPLCTGNRNLKAPYSLADSIKEWVIWWPGPKKSIKLNNEPCRIRETECKSTTGYLPPDRTADGYLIQPVLETGCRDNSKQYLESIKQCI